MKQKGNGMRKRMKRISFMLIMSCLRRVSEWLVARIEKRVNFSWLTVALVDHWPIEFHRFDHVH